MPRVELIDPMGRSRVIDSSDPKLIAAWIVEKLPEVASEPHYPGQVRVWPSFLWDPETKREVPDWPPNVADTFQVFVKDGGVAGVRLLIKELSEWARRQQT